MSSKLSIVTAVKNRKKDLFVTLKSIFDQTYPSIELIVIDGGSTDGTVELIQQYQDRIAYWVSEPDYNVYDAMNKGLRQTTGDWVLFLNAGDTFCNTSVVSQVFSQSLQDIKFIYGDTCLVTELGEEIRYLKAEHLTYYSLSKGMIACHQAMFVKHDICPEYNLKWFYKGELNWAMDIFQSLDMKHVLYLPVGIVNYQMSAYSMSLFYKHFFQLITLVFQRYGIAVLILRIPRYLRRFFGHAVRTKLGVHTLRIWEPYIKGK